MRKRISTITLLIILVNIFGQCIVGSAEPEKTISPQEEFCLENEFFSKKDYNPDAIVSRGAFTEVVANIAGLEVVTVEQDKWAGYVYEGSIDEGDGTIFKDVDASHPYYSSIKAVVDAGYMDGISANTFAPEVNLTLKQAYITFLDMINYKKVAEVEGGYVKLARNLGITKGLSVSENDYLSYKELAKVIYNMLDVKSYNYYMNETKTFMSDVLKMKEVRGFLTDNGYTAIDGASTIGENFIKVGDIVAQVPASKEYMRNYIGREVKLYYIYEDADTYNNVAAYMVCDSKSDVYTLDRENFIEYTESAIKYYKSGRSRTISLSKVQHMIYNNRSVGVFDESIFEFDAGEITVIPKSVGGKTVIAITSVEHIYVASVDAEKQEIENKLKHSDTDKNIDVLELRNYDRISIVSEDGDEMSLENILAGNVLEVIRNNSQIRITVVARSEKNFYISNIEENEFGTKTVYGDNKSYDIAYQYYHSPRYKTPDENLETTQNKKAGFELGKFYDFYLNSKNQIVWAEPRTGDFQIGYLIETNVYDEETRITLSDMEGRVNKYYCATDFIISDSSGKRHRKLSEDDIEKYLGGVNDLIRFKFNKEGLINYIELPMDTMPENDDRLYKIVNTREQYPEGGEKPYPYQRGGMGFGGTLGVLSTVKLLKVPADAKDYKKYKKTTIIDSFNGSDNGRRFIAYTTKRNAFAAEYVIALEKVGEVEKLKTKRAFFVVNKISTEILDDEYNVGKAITGYLVYGDKLDVAKKEMTLYCSEEYYDVINSMANLYENALGVVQNTYQLQSGDIIRVSYDEYNYVNMAELVFRPTLAHQDNPESGTMGTLAGSIGYFDSTNPRSNPVVLTSTVDPKNNNSYYVNGDTVKRPVGLEFWLAMSWVNDKYEDVYQITTQDLSKGAFDPTGANGRYLVQAVNMSATSMVLVEYDGAKVKSIRPATSQDIKTREEVGAKCSRIIHNWYYGGGLHGFVINGL